MAKIKQIGVGRKTTGTIDGITYVTRKGVTYARASLTMPASAYTNPAARRRQAIFKLVQMHIKYHLRTIRQTVSPSESRTAANRYCSINYRYFMVALSDLADQYVAGLDVSLADVENAISAYAAEHPMSIRIASLSGYQEVFLTGEWPQVITLDSTGTSDSTMVVYVDENSSSSEGSSNGSGEGNGGDGGSGDGDGDDTD